MLSLPPLPLPQVEEGAAFEKAAAEALAAAEQATKEAEERAAQVGADRDLTDSVFAQRCCAWHNAAILIGRLHISAPQLPCHPAPTACCQD